MSVQVTCAPDGAELACSKAPGDWWVLQSFTKDGQIMAFSPKQALPTAIAGHQQHGK
tara:strand:+ start:73 stop:243 length:171 start_codon:yes stop_codon:yes gene_type:complete